MSSALAASETSARKTKSDSLSFKDSFLPGSETKVALKLQQNLHLQTACFLCKISRSRATIPVSRHYNRKVSTADSTIQPRHKNSRPLAPIFLQPRTRSNTIPRLLLLLLAKVCFGCTQKQFLRAIWTIPQTERENLNAKLEIGVSIIRGRLRTRERKSQNKRKIENRLQMIQLHKQIQAFQKKIFLALQQRSQILTSDNRNYTRSSGDTRKPQNRQMFRERRN